MKKGRLPLYMKRKEWHVYDKEKHRMVPSENAPPEAVESYLEELRQEKELEEIGHKIFEEIAGTKIDDLEEFILGSK